MAGADPNPILRRHGGWTLFLLGLLLLLPGSGTIPLLDRDEPRFARATVEMMQRGTWVVPYFNSDPAVSDATRIAEMHAGAGSMSVGYRFDKPVLTYWLMRIGYALFGVSELGARLHSILSASLLAVVIFFMGRRWFGARAGFIAGFGMLTCVQIMIHGRSAVADVPMVLFVCTAMWALWELVGNAECGMRNVELKETTSSARHSSCHIPHSAFRIFFYVSLGLGFLAKGPIALIVPLVAALLWRFVFWRRPAPWRNLKLHLGLPLTLAIIGAWGIPALIQTAGLFWKIGIGEHVVDRGVKAFDGRFPFPLFYFFTAFVSLFPWSIYVGGVWRVARDAWRAARGRLTAPAAAGPAADRAALNCFLVSWFLAPFLIFTFYATQLMHYIMPGFAAFFLLLAQHDKFAGGKFPRGFRGVAVAMVVLMLVAPPLAGKFLRPRTPAVEMRGFIRHALHKTPDAKLAWSNFTEPSVVFYSNHHWLTTTNPAEFLSQPGPRILLYEISETPPDLPFARKKGARDYSAGLAALPTNGCATLDVSGIAVGRDCKTVKMRLFYRDR